MFIFIERQENKQTRVIVGLKVSTL